MTLTLIAIFAAVLWSDSAGPVDPASEDVHDWKRVTQLEPGTAIILTTSALKAVRVTVVEASCAGIVSRRFGVMSDVIYPVPRESVVEVRLPSGRLIYRAP